MSTLLRYPVVLYPNDEGVAVNCPALPGCWSQGTNDQEALENIAYAIREYLLSIWEERIEGGRLTEVEVAV